MTYTNVHQEGCTPIIVATSADLAFFETVYTVGPLGAQVSYMARYSYHSANQLSTLSCASRFFSRFNYVYGSAMRQGDNFVTTYKSTDVKRCHL